MSFVFGFMLSNAFALAKSVARIQQALTNRRAARELLKWDVRGLKDIGLTPNEVEGAFAVPFWQDPTLLLVRYQSHKEKTRTVVETKTESAIHATESKKEGTIMTQKIGSITIEDAPRLLQAS